MARLKTATLTSLELTLSDMSETEVTQYLTSDGAAGVVKSWAGTASHSTTAHFF